MIRALAPIAFTFACCAFDAGATVAGSLLQVEGRTLRWEPLSPETGAVITYAVLTGPYNVPSDRPILSAGNCAAMHSFADIVALSPGVSEETAKEQLRSAFAAWEEAANVRFVEVDDIRHANIIVGAEDEPAGRAFANLSYRSSQGAKPVAKALGAPVAGPKAGLGADGGIEASAAIEQAYVCLNPKQRWKVGLDGNHDVYDLRYTFTHEIGHTLGLDHPESAGALMAYRYDERVGGLQPPDIAAVQKLYGPRKREE